MKETIHANPVQIVQFSYVNQCEAEIIRMCLDLYKGGPGTCGLTTSGGTESILQALLCYREIGRKHRGITKPNFVVSDTAHPAFYKAAYYFQL